MGRGLCCFRKYRNFKEGFFIEGLKLSVGIYVLKKDLRSRFFVYKQIE